MTTYRLLARYHKWLLLGGLGMLLACGRSSARQEGLARPVSAAPGSVAVVRVQKTARGFRLLRAGKPYFLKGAAGTQCFAQLQAAGGNTVRLWSTEYAGPLLDEAQRHGLTVMLGLWMEPEHKTFSYYDPALVRAQRERVRQQVLRYRHHPALLMWNVANELELSTQSPQMFSAINELSDLIHELDPYHPVTASFAVSSLKMVPKLQRLAPALDILSVNVYASLGEIPATLRAVGWQGPYIISEYGSRGYWESNSTNWQAPLEETSAQKADFVVTRYRQAILRDSARCLGGYVFYWGSKVEHTATWFSLFEPTGEKTALVDEMTRLWRGHYPANRAPRLTQLRLAGQPASNNVQLPAGRSYPASVQVSDPEGDSLTTRWEMLPERPPGATSPELTGPLEPLEGSILQVQRRQALVRIPEQPGYYRLFVRVFDGHGNVATANLPLASRAAADYSAATGQP